MQGIGDLAEDTSLTDVSDDKYLDLKLFNVEYTEENGQPIVHCFCRDEGGERYHIEVDGHRPSFFIQADEYSQRIDNHYAVHHTETHDSDGERYTDLYDNPLVRIYTELPDQVADMRELFDWTGEADVFYTKRFCIDTGVHAGIRVDTSDAHSDDWVSGDMRVDVSAVEALSDDATPTLDPKIMVIDIEVASDSEVPDTDEADEPVTTIVAWDSYSERYVGWFYRIDCHDDVSPSDADDADVDELRVFDDESALLADFNDYVANESPDIFTGWFSQSFDVPYLVNRSKNVNAWNYQDWSPLGEVYIGRFDPTIKGVAAVDMLDAYKKTQIHNLTSQALDDVAEREGVGGKIDITTEGSDDDHTQMWKENPIEFLRYNKVDVELVHRIDESSGAIDLLDNLRSVVGCSYSDPIGGNIDMMDVLFLRKAREYGYALPTSTEPDVTDYHGAYVYTPEAGMHENVCYPDFSSLYPNIMYQCNISPETLVGTRDDLEQSPYTEDDCVWSYVDTETPPPQKEDIEPTEDMMEKVYFLDPSVETGFIRNVLDDVMGLADQYTGDMYAAVKRVRNSAYGVVGDSDSYGCGFRLYDWRMSEAVTLGGQRVLKEGGRKFTEFVSDPDARVIYGDTDSVVTTFPNAGGPEDALEQAQSAATDLNEYLEGYTAEQFGLASEDESAMEIEIESVADGIFFKGKNNGTSDEGVKKRYVQRVVWDDDDFWLDDPDIDITGFEYVRSDVAQITKDVQATTFEYLLNEPLDEAEALVKEYVKDVIHEAISGEMDDNRLGIPFGLSQDLGQYGSKDRQPQPQYRGAKYANSEIYGERAITTSSDAIYFYTQEGYTGDYRKTYDATTAEGGRYVDAISVLDADDVPDGFRIDRRKMVEKTIIGPMEAIFNTLGWGIEWAEAAMDEATPPEYWRDENQAGLSAAEWM